MSQPALTRPTRTAQTPRERLQAAAERHGWWWFGTGRAVRLERGDVTYSVAFNTRGAVTRATGPEGPIPGIDHGPTISAQLLEVLALPNKERAHEPARRR